VSKNVHLVNWTPELVERCRILWEVEEMSASAIAEVIGGGATKNSIIGKSHREHWRHKRVNTGWSGGKRVKVRSVGSHARGVERKRAAKPPRSVTRAQKPKKAPPVPPVVIARPAPLPVIVSGPVRLLDLERGQCRWPMNAPAKGLQYLFCGEPQVAERSYCAVHCKVGYVGTARQKSVSGWTPRPQEMR